MVIKATVVARFNTASVSFARLVLKGQPEMKNSGAFKFLDVKDDGELSIGDKLEISITRVVEGDVSKAEATVLEFIQGHQGGTLSETNAGR